MAVQNVDEYIAEFPDDVQLILQRVRETIHRVLPDAEEKIRYGIPAIALGGGTRYWLHFAGWKKHIGLYPVAMAEGELEQQLAPYRAAKDSVNFFYAKPIPYDLIERTTRFLVERRR